MNKSPQTAVLIYTYNEAENIPPIFQGILSLNLDLFILVVDDNSPDGTGKVVTQMAGEDSKIKLIQRERNKGRGSAAIDALKYVLFEKPEIEYIIEMDGDGSHDVKYIPEFIKAIKNADMVIGSRYIIGGADKRRGVFKKLVSAFAKELVKLMFKTEISDPTSGYRCYTRETLNRIKVDTLSSKGPIIVSEVLFRCLKAKCNIKEIPIVFLNRRHGKSKLKAVTLLKYPFELIKLRRLISNDNSN